MYFEIENTPERLKRARRVVAAPNEDPAEEIPQLVLAPFTRPPQVVFDNVAVGSTVRKELEILNPSKNIQQITLTRALPPGLHLALPSEWLELEPQTCYSLILQWTPPQPMALRDTLRFVNENRRSFDVVLILKTLTAKKKIKDKNVKCSPRRIVKKPVTKKSPVSSNNKKVSPNFQGFKIKQVLNEVQTTVKYKTVKSTYTDSIPTVYADYSIEQDDGNPFDSACVFFDTSEMFSNIKRTNLQATYSKEVRNEQIKDCTYDNVLKPTNKQNISCSDIFDNIKFTPLKSEPQKRNNINVVPKILSTQDSIENLETFDKENNLDINIPERETIKWPQLGNLTPYNAKTSDKHINKKLPNTSSPKEVDNVNFSINTDFSHISNDLSFIPQRVSTEKKTSTKLLYNVEDNYPNPIFGSDTYTKLDSPINGYMAMDYHMANHPIEHNPKSRQSLFSESGGRNDMYQGNIDKALEALLNMNSSPARSTSPFPLQAIAEESSQYSDSRYEKPMTTFTVNRTFNKTVDKSNTSKARNSKDSWSKKSVKCEPELWKIPVTLPKKRDTFNVKRDLTQTLDVSDNHNSIMSVTIPTGNVYSQSLTVDPFSSTTYFYDESAVHKFEKEFKRWLNYILTPPADLDSNIEHKVDFGKAWIENRNKDVPAAPTKEQVSSKYHNSHRLEALRKAARVLFKSPEISEVVAKVNAQIEKKLIAIRSDKNLHLDVGLQKIIMELLLCYNPLWLRIGLEAIYSIVIPLRSNSDIEGLSTFIIQRMFRNPYLKNKNTKSNIPNMLLPAYLEAIKKFTLKKFFVLVLFLDRAKQKRLISHDPCLFCRNATYKESREILIRFTRELIAGIGDITRHLRPLGYVVCHKQTYLDEYKYAVHNIATDIRDGVRLTKVMEIILMKNGLLNHLRTPPISRLQKIHNVQVALDALKEADFVIVGDIAPYDIADGHREKTLSLLWQIIHVFRAPLFETAATVIQTWWKKKYEVIMVQRRKEEEVLRRQHDAASVIQCWWRRIQHNRLVEMNTKQLTASTVIIQKYVRKWICRRRLIKLKVSVLAVEAWWKNLKLMRASRENYVKTRRASCILQKHIRAYLAMKSVHQQYLKTKQAAITIQKYYRQYIKLKTSVIIIQRKYRAHLLMKKELENYKATRDKIICIQSYIRMLSIRKRFLQLKNAVKIIEDRYIAIRTMRQKQGEFNELKKTVTILQSFYRCKKTRSEYSRQRNLIIRMQNRIRANIAMKKDREKYNKIKHAAVVLQNRFRAYLTMKSIHQQYLRTKQAAITIQRYYRHYIKVKTSVIIIQRKYRAHLLMKKELENYKATRDKIICIQSYIRMLLIRKRFLQVKNAVKIIEDRYIAIRTMRQKQGEFNELKKTVTILQSFYRCKKTRSEYLRQRNLIIRMQNRIRANIAMKKEREKYNKIKQAAGILQNRFRAYLTMKPIHQQYLKTKQSVITIQRYYRYYIKVKTSVIIIQRKYRAHLLMKKELENYKATRDKIICIQSYIRMLLIRKRFLQVKNAVKIIEDRYIALRTMKQKQGEFKELKKTVIILQSFYRCKKARSEYLRQKNVIISMQNRVRANIAMKKDREKYNKIKQAAGVLQNRFRAYLAMKPVRQEYIKYKLAATTIQKYFRDYIKIKKSVILIQRKYRAHLHMKRDLANYKSTQNKIIKIQSYFRMFVIYKRYKEMKNAVKVIQDRYRAIVLMRKAQNEFYTLKNTVIMIQSRYRSKKARSQLLLQRQRIILLQSYFKMLLVRKQYKGLKHSVRIVEERYLALRNMRESRHKFLLLKRTVTWVQASYRAKKVRLEKLNERNIIIRMQRRIKANIAMKKQREQYLKMKHAACVIQDRLRSYLLMRKVRMDFIKTQHATMVIQRYFRCYLYDRRRYLRLRSAVLTIQYQFKWLKLRGRIQAKIQERKDQAAIVIQKNVRRYLARSHYQKYRRSIVLIQKAWKSKLFIRYLRCVYLQKKQLIIKLQALIRGYMVRREFANKRQEMERIHQEYIRTRAATKIQAYYRGHLVRKNNSSDHRVVDLRKRWRQGALKSNQQTMRERSLEALEVIANFQDMLAVNRAFKLLELVTEVYPMLYEDNVDEVVSDVYMCMGVANRSVSSVEMLTSAAAVLANFARYPRTAVVIYQRERIHTALKYMLRFCTKETHLVCILCTYVWLFKKYDNIREDLSKYLRLPELQKTLEAIKKDTERMVRMRSVNMNRSVMYTPRHKKLNSSLGTNSSRSSSVTSLLPALEPDYGIVKANKPRYFQDPLKAIECLYKTYKL